MFSQNKLKVPPYVFGYFFQVFGVGFGKIMVVNPARWAAKIFSLTPPISKTLPRSVTSPVIPTSRLTGILVRAETRVVVMAIPAEGPSLGTAPSGAWVRKTNFWAKIILKTQKNF